jgi:hypothetical protein
MKCPHCDVGVHETLTERHVFGTYDGRFNDDWYVLHQQCSECSEPIIFLECRKIFTPSGTTVDRKRILVFPKAALQRPVPAQVPNPYRQDFIEACEVLSLSPKASSALSRRNLQAIIHDKAGVKERDLNAEIQVLIDSGKVPTHISEGLHAVRQIGNFAAHPIKSTSTGEIVDVESGEAEWNLDVLELLFDFYFVQPAIAAKRKAELNQKLKDAGKPPLA